MSHEKIQHSIQVTLRGLPRDVIRELKREARKQRRSLNHVLLDRLSPRTTRPREGACSELLRLAGTWDRERADEFDSRAGEHRKIDSELWS